MIRQHAAAAAAAADVAIALMVGLSISLLCFFEIVALDLSLMVFG